MSTNDAHGAAIAVVSVSSTPKVKFKQKHQTRGRLRYSIVRVGHDEGYRQRLTRHLMATGIVRHVRLDIPSRSLVVDYDPTQQAAAFVQERVAVCIQAALDPTLVLDLPAAGEDGEYRIDYWKRLSLPGAAIALAAVSFGGLAVPPLLMGGVIVAAAAPSYLRAWRGIRDEKKLNVDFLDSTAITLLASLGIFFPPALMISLIESGEIIRDMTARRTARANLDLLDSLGSVARIERDGVVIEVALIEVVVGDIVVVYPGDQIPVDGTIVSGIGLVDQQKLTGESIPVTREEGQDVLAATLVVDGVLRIKTNRTGENTRAGVVVALMKTAPVHDTRMEDYARKIGDRIVVPTLVLGGAVTLATGGNIVAGVAVITLDIGTGIRVSVPTAILASLTFAARHGILIRSGRALEQLALVDTVVFDKTGTLTQGKAGVVAIISGDDQFDAQRILWLAATAEQGLTHPVAEAIVRHARETEVIVGECSAWEYRVGQGIVATIDEQVVYVGSPRMMDRLGIATGPLQERHPEIAASAASQVYVAGDNGLLGVILYKDPARPETPGVIASLADLELPAYMLSGDLRPVARAMAAEVGIPADQVYAETFPERKVEVVKELQENGKTIAFVGDGINDTAALAHASVSVSFAGATDMARETADVVLMDDDLRSLILAIQIARQSMAVVRQNAGIVVGPNLSAMVWAALVGLNPVAAVVINNGSAIVAEMNGFRPLLGPAGWEKDQAARTVPAASASSRDESDVAASNANGQIIDASIVATGGPTTVATNGSNGHANGTNGTSHNAPDIADMVISGPVAKRRGGGKRSSGGNGAVHAADPSIGTMPAQTVAVE